MLSLETLSLRDAGGPSSSSFFSSATAGSFNVAAGDASSSSLFSSAAAGSGAATNPQDAYVEWIAEIIASHGGVMTSANLGSSLVADDAEKYATVRATWGGLCSLLSRNPQRFRLLNNQPLNHVAVVGATRRVRKAPKPEPTQPTPDAAAATAHADEVLVVAHTQEILAGASERALKAVDLANALRSRVGVAVLARVRTHRGGLLSLLERHNDVLEVFRVPKHDVCAVWKSSRRRRGNSTLSRRHHVEWGA
jgi:hypothetical protein